MKLNRFIQNGLGKTLCAGLVALVAHSATATDITIQPGELTSKDTFAYSFLTTWGFDTASLGFGAVYGGILAAGATTSGAHDTVSFIEFSLDAAEELTGSDVIEARLYLYVGNATSAGFGQNPSTAYPVDISVYQVEESWTESTLTWGNHPSYSGTLDTVNISGIGAYVSFDVTGAVRDWLDGVSSNFGFALEQDSPVASPNGQVFGVFESSAATNKPYLKITY